MSSLLFYLLFLIIFWKFTRTILEKRESDYLTLAIALQPTLLMVATAINPEIGAVAFFSLALAALFAGLKAGYASLTFGVLLGFLSAQAILTKFTNVILIPVILLSLALYLKGGWQQKLRSLAAYFVSTVVTLSPWFIFNLSHYSSLLPHNLEFYSTNGVNTSSINFSDLLMITIYDFNQSIQALLGVFGWMDAPIFYEWRLIYTFLCIAFLVVGIWFFFGHREDDEFLQPVGFISSFSLIFLVIFLIAYSVYMKINFQLVNGLQGRYYLVGLLPGAIVFYKGAKQVLRIRNPETLSKYLFFFSLLFFLVSVLFTLVPRFYV